MYKLSDKYDCNFSISKNGKLIDPDDLKYDKVLALLAPVVWTIYDFYRSADYIDVYNEDEDDEDDSLDE